MPPTPVASKNENQKPYYILLRIGACDVIILACIFGKVKRFNSTIKRELSARFFLYTITT